MKKIPFQTTDGETIYRLQAENEEDLQQLYEMERQGVLDANESFGDYFEEWDEEKKKKMIEEAKQTELDHPELEVARQKARDWAAARRKAEREKDPNWGKRRRVD